MRKLEGERIADLRQRIWSELAGRPDPRDPMKTVRPGPDQVMAMIGTAVKVGRHEAMIFGLDAPSKSDVVTRITGQPMSDEELNAGLARLTEEERETFMMLLAKLQGRWVELPPPSVETTAVALEPPSRNGRTSTRNGIAYVQQKLRAMG